MILLIMATRLVDHTARTVIACRLSVTNLSQKAWGSHVRESRTVSPGHCVTILLRFVR